MGARKAVNAGSIDEMRSEPRLILRNRRGSDRISSIDRTRIDGLSGAHLPSRRPPGSLRRSQITSSESVSPRAGRENRTMSENETQAAQERDLTPEELIEAMEASFRDF